MSQTQLDRKWAHLIELCESESRLRGARGHARVLKLIASEIEQLATELGSHSRRIATRDFRAIREDGHIVHVLKD